MPKATNTSAGCWPSVGAPAARGCRLTAVVMRPSCSEGELVGPAQASSGRPPLRSSPRPDESRVPGGSSDPHDAEPRVAPGPSRPMTPPPGPAPVDPAALLRTRSYVQLLLLAGLIGVPVSCVAYGFLWLVSELQDAALQRPSRPARLRRPRRRGGRSRCSRWAACSPRRRSSGSRAPAGTIPPTASSRRRPAPGRAPRRRARRPRDAELRRGARPRGAAHRRSAAAWACSPSASPRATRRPWPRR